MVLAGQEELHAHFEIATIEPSTTAISTLLLVDAIAKVKGELARSPLEIANTGKC